MLSGHVLSYSEEWKIESGNEYFKGGNVWGAYSDLGTLLSPGGALGMNIRPRIKRFKYLKCSRDFILLRFSQLL